jgi:hypothetical protein
VSGSVLGPLGSSGSRAVEYAGETPKGSTRRGETTGQGKMRWVSAINESRPFSDESGRDSLIVVSVPNPLRDQPLRIIPLRTVEPC